LNDVSLIKARSVAAWLLALAPAAMLAVLLLRPVWDVDVFWQLKLGELTLAGGVQRQEPFAATHLAETLPAFAWMGQAVMAAVRQALGWTGLRVFDALCWLGGFLAVAAACRRRSGSAAGVLLALAIAFFAALPMASIRPQSLAALCFGALLALLRLEMRPWQTTVLAVPLLLVWQNLHPSVSVAALVLVAHAAVGWWRRLRVGARPPWEESVLALVAGAMMFATPDGWAVLQLSAENARASAAMGVSEWLPLWDGINRFEAVPVLLTAVVTSWVLLRNPRRIDGGELAAAIVLFALTAFAYRFVLFWAIALIPVVARAVPPPIERRTPAWLTPVALIAVAIVTPPLRPTHFAETIPLAAIDRLHAAGIKGTIFAHFPWGGPVIDVGYPDWRVAYDGRYYRYTPQEWQRYRRMGLAEIEQRYRPAGFVLSSDWNGPLIAELRGDRAHWQQLSADGTAVVFKRKAAATP
jgi:SAM-dependent methyltransferase